MAFVEQGKNQANMKYSTNSSVRYIVFVKSPRTFRGYHTQYNSTVALFFLGQRLLGTLEQWRVHRLSVCERPQGKPFSSQVELRDCWESNTSTCYCTSLRGLSYDVVACFVNNELYCGENRLVNHAEGHEADWVLTLRSRLESSLNTMRKEMHTAH